MYRTPLIDFKNRKVRRCLSKFKNDDIKELIIQETRRLPIHGCKKAADGEDYANAK